MPRRSDGAVTKELILNTAAKVFARNGFAKTTHAEIARECGNINSALINYYFGDKATLYAKVWEHANEVAAAKYPFPSSTDDCLSTVKWLKAIINAAIRRRSDVECYAIQIMLMELSCPTGILNDVYERSILELKMSLKDVVREFLGHCCTVDEQNLAALSIFSMCVVPLRQIQNLHDNYDEFQVVERIEHVYNFAMAGLLDILNTKGCE